MLSLRALSRALPRSSIRASSSFLLPLASYSRSSFLQSTPKPSHIPIYSSFSTSFARREPASDTDQELSAKLNLEARIEESSRDSSNVPESIQTYLEESGFQILDKPGTQYVTLTKQFVNETVKVDFSIADVNMEEDMEDLEEDPALDDEDFESAPTSKRNINQVKGGAVDVAPEDSIAPADRAGRGEEEDIEESEGDESAAMPINLTATITKASGGAIEVMARAEDGVITVQEVHYYPSANLADASTPEEGKEASSLYLGPPFGNLDPELISMLERYVDERGINSALAMFLPEYVDYKEQREYVGWLGNMKTFIDA